MTIEGKKKYLLISLSIIFADQISKYFIKSSLNPFKSIDVIDGFFRLIYTENAGAVWGLLSHKRGTIIPTLISVFAIGALVFISYQFLKIRKASPWEFLSLSFIIGGALGNIIDRIFQGYVVDFFYFYVKDFSWPAFNVADMFISIGLVILTVLIIMGKSVMAKDK